MRYRKRRRLYSQNNLVNPQLIAKLIRNSSIGKKDTVLEIGPGKGIVTQELAKTARRVIAVEIDRILHFRLKDRFKDSKNLELVCNNFLNYNLPQYAYKVFANIPFSITADIIRKLTSDTNFREGYLIVQKEAAKRFIGMPYDAKNQMAAVLLKPWFDIKVFWEFKRDDFVPRPNIDTAMIRIKRRSHSLIEDENKEIYKDFVIYTYNYSRVSRLHFTEFLELFNNFLLHASSKEKRSMHQKASFILKAQEQIQKIHRSRKANNWKKFK